MLAAGLMLQTISVHAGYLSLQALDAETGLPLADVVMEVELPENLHAQFLSPAEREVDQQDKEFVARATLITRNSQVRFPNSDNILHHVYSFSAAKVFELPLYGSGRNIDYLEKFEVAGVVELGCNIHDWMLGYIYVAETDFAVVTGADGKGMINNIPAGSYRVKLWHPRALPGDPALEQEVSVSDGELTQLRIALSLSRDHRLRRAPGPSRSRYR